MRAEYDFSAGARGKYGGQAEDGLVVLGPDVTEVFPGPEAMNPALPTPVQSASSQSRTTSRDALD
ncbi:MAG: hypothetical protein FJX76_18290 [Armatimonadetes bacterium]|nr:hypothetical protein [Armatimonadota bacterium]